MELSDFTKGEELYFPAWWTKPSKSVLCRVAHVGSFCIDVLPLEGNPHMRSFCSQVKNWTRHGNVVGPD